MSFAANVNKPPKYSVETDASTIAKQQKIDRERIRRLIITLGDDNKKMIGQIRGLAGALEDDVELHGDLIAETILECAKHIPLKTSIYSAFVARMMEKHSAWVAALMPKMLTELQTALRTSQVTVAQLLLQFVVGLGNYGVVGLTSVLGLLGEVLDLSEGLRPGKGGDLGAFLALASLPYFSPSARSKVAEQLQQNIIAKAGAYVSSRDARWKPLLRILKSEDIPDRLEALVLAIQSLQTADWNSQSILLVPGFESSLQGRPGMPDLQSLAMSSEDIRRLKVRLHVPLVTSRFLTRQMESDGADDHMLDHDRWVLEDYILLIVDMFGRDVDECARQILKIPVLHPDFEAIAVESVFSQMLRLPSPPSLPLFYSRLLEAFVEKQTSTKPLVDQAFRALAFHAPDLDDECIEVLAEAFAYHLMHSGYQSDWSPFIGDGVTAQAQRFARRALERLQRLSFHQNLLHRLPEAVHVYVPPEPLAASSSLAQGKKEFTHLAGLIRIKDPDEHRVISYCDHLQCKQPKGRRRQKEGLADPTGEGEIVGEVVDHAGVEQSKRRRLNHDCHTTEPLDKVVDPGRGDVHDDSHGGSEVVSVRQDMPQESDVGIASCPKQEATQDDSKSKSEIKVEAANIEQNEADGATDAPVEPWSLAAVAELLTVAVLHNGSKTPTHMNKILDGHAQIFEKLRPHDDDETHSYAKLVVRCIFDFWRFSSQRLEITIEAMLQRGILTPRAVVEHALSERGPQGCDSMAVRNIIDSVARKSLEHSQSVRVELALAKQVGKTQVLDSCRRQLDGAIQETAELFTLIFTGLVRNHQDFEDTNALLRHVMLQRVLTVGRKYHLFIKPLIDAAESRIPGVAHNPEVAATFQLLRTL